jgi:hypothetical protein
MLSEKGSSRSATSVAKKRNDSESRQIEPAYESIARLKEANIEDDILVEEMTFDLRKHNKEAIEARMS